MITFNEPNPQFIIDKEKLKNDLKQNPNTKIFFLIFLTKGTTTIKRIMVLRYGTKPRRNFLF